MARGTASVLACGAIVLLAGCGADEVVANEPTSPPASAATALPSASVVATPSVKPEPSTTAPVSDEEAEVLAAYRAFYAAVDEAQADPPRSQDYLAPVATGAQFEITNGGIKAGFIEGEEDLGSPVLRPVVESIEGDTAVVHDCQDTSSVETRVRDTGEVLTIGMNPSSATTVLTRVDGAWKVSATDFPPDPAAYCS